MPTSKRRKPKRAACRQPAPSLQRFVGIAHFIQRNPFCTVRFSHAGGTGVVVYKPSGSLLSGLGRVGGMGWGTGRFSALARLLAAHIVEWNIGRDGQILPITHQALMDLPAALLMRIALVLARDLRDRAQEFASEAGRRIPLDS